MRTGLSQDHVTREIFQQVHKIQNLHHLQEQQVPRRSERGGSFVNKSCIASAHLAQPGASQHFHSSIREFSKDVVTLLNRWLKRV